MKLRIEKAVYGGDCLAHVQPQDATGEERPLAGKACFVPNTLPGELVEARITGNRRGFSTGELDAILEPSPERIPPGCEYFSRCGGCHYQHAGAAYQLQIKLAVLKETLARAHLPPIEPAGVLQAQPWEYRNRIRLQVAPSRSGQGFDLCYRARGSHAGLAVTHCPIAAPLLQRAIAAALQCGREGIACPGNEIEFFTNGEQDSLLVSLWSGEKPEASRDSEWSLRHFAEQLRARIPSLAGAGLFPAGGRENRLIAGWGARYLTYAFAERSYRVSLGSFFQVNRFLAPKLLDLVAGGRSGRLAWDLYSGVGLFAQALDFETVIAVEAAAASAGDLQRNLAGTGRRAVHSGILDFLRGQARGKLRAAPDLVVLDPPRAGLGKEVCVRLAQFSAPCLLYISCDPATLARDLQTLLQFGYAPREIYLVDLFPQTFHLETVAVLACA